MRRRRWPWIWGSVAALLLIVAALWVWWFLSSKPRPEDAARAYLEALATGDGMAAVEGTVGLDPVALYSFVRVDEYLSEPQVLSVSENDDGATAQVSYRLGEEYIETELSLRFVDDAWQVEAEPGGISLTTSVGSAAQVGLFGHDGLSADEPLVINLFPALYKVSAAPDEFLDAHTMVAVPLGEHVPVHLEPRLAEGATAAAADAFADVVASCTAPATDFAEGCGLRIPWAAELASLDEVRYRVERQPTLTLTTSDFRAENGVLIATVSGTGHDGAAHSATFRTERWSFQGEVSFNRAGVIFTLR